MKRDRACAALLRNDKILMVCHKTPSRTYWTLPGGGQEDDESIEQTVVREVKEETGLDVRVTRLLFEEEYQYGISYCYLAELINGNTDPTLDFLPAKETISSGTLLHSAAWHSIKDKKEDIQISKVISILGIDLTSGT